MRDGAMLSRWVGGTNGRGTHPAGVEEELAVSWCRVRLRGEMVAMLLTVAIRCRPVAPARHARIAATACGLPVECA